MRLRNRVLAMACAAAVVVGSLAYTPATTEAAKAPKLSKSKLTITEGKTVTLKVKNGKKKAKVTWKSSKAKVAKITKKVAKGNKASAKIKALKPGKAKITASYKLGKKTKKLKCNVTVKKKVDPVVTQAPIQQVPTQQAPTQAPVQPTPAPTPTPDPFTIIDNNKATAMMYIDKNDSEYDGISLIAEAFKADVARVAGIGVDDEGVAKESPNGLQVVTDSSKLAGKAIIAGTIGGSGNALINQLVSEGKLDVSDVQGKWECYKLQVVKNPMPGVDEALVIAGSDKRGTIYGIFRLSELMGVSPWVWWADATPAVQSKVDLPGVEINVTSKEPSVKYRGIFLNDEAPSLTNWTNAKFGGRNQYFYKHVYELILRLKGDYLWPAMWRDEFSLDGADGDSLANAKLADQYGVVMGASHHEPCYRAGNEWGMMYSQYKGSLNLSAADAWNKYNLPDADGYNEKVNTAIEKFWNDGIARNAEFDNICTVGMRGEADSSLPAADDPPRYAELLNHIITKQKELLAANGDENPTMLVIYKEVENAWNEGALYDQECMKDTIAMFCDDNWAYLRTLPTADIEEKVGGLGMYYHFDYVGAPKSYTWVQTTQISRVWDQMSVAYDYGINDVWIVNVGDLKPMEMDISYFLDLGYDFEKWGVNGNEKIEEYKINWVTQQLGKADGSGLNPEQLAEANQLIADYLDLQTSRKVEHVLYNTAETCTDMFSVKNYNEAQDILMKCNDIMARAEALKAQVPDDLQAAFYQLVYYPAMSVPNVLKIQIYAALNSKYAAMNLTAANAYADKCTEAIALDQELYDTYNNAMPGAPEDGKKWKGMQSADQKYHIGMESWNTDSGKLPTLKKVTGTAGSGMSVLVQGITDSMTVPYTSGTATLPTFTSTNKEAYTIELNNTGSASYDFTAVANADWIKLSKTSGTVNAIENIEVSVDWSKVTADASSTVTVSDGSNTVTVEVNAQVVDVAGLDAKTYVMANDYATINVTNFAASKNGVGFDYKGSYVDNNMVVVPDNGKYMGSVRTTRSTVTYSDENELVQDAPYVEYKVYVPENGTYNIQCQFNPTSNVVYQEEILRYGISIDGAAPTITNSIVDNYLAGTWAQGTWAGDIENNGRSSTVSNVSLTAGVHTIRYYQMDPNMALIRMTVYSGSLAKVYNSPAESYFVGKEVNTDAVIAKKNNMYDFVK